MTDQQLQTLLASWRDRWSWMLSYAEEAFFAGDEDKEHHMVTCARQWRNAIEELEHAMAVPLDHG